MKKWTLIVVVVAAALAVGCRKQDAAAGPNATPAPEQTADSNSTSTAAAIAPAGPIALPADAPPVTVSEGGNTSATLTQLTKELHHLIARTHQLPANFEDFAVKAHLQAPPPPAGKKYAISSDWKVVLANR
jgi:hypothetical protein